MTQILLARISWKLWILLISFGLRLSKLTICLPLVSISEMAMTLAITNVWLILCLRNLLTRLRQIRTSDCWYKLMMMEIVVWQPTPSLAHLQIQPKELCGDSCIGTKSIWHSTHLVSNRIFTLVCTKRFIFLVLARYFIKTLKTHRSSYPLATTGTWMVPTYKRK